MRDLYAIDPFTGRQTLVGSQFVLLGDMYFNGNPNMGGYPYAGGFPYLTGYGRRNISPFRGFDAFNSLYPWDWAVCHAGTWIRWQHHYVWVAGTKRHHHHPVRWVKTGHGLGFVPIHPRDVAGKPPINLKEGIFRVTGKKEAPVERVTYREGDPLKLLDGTPKEFLRPDLHPLKIAEIPHPTAHSAFAATIAAKDATAARGIAIAKPTAVTNSTVARGFVEKDQGTPITFDRKSQSFSVTHQVTENGRPTTVTQTLGGGGRAYEPSGNYGSSAARNTGSCSYSNPGSSNSGSSRSYTPAPSYNSGSSSGGSYSHTSAPAPAPAPSFSGGGGGGSAPSSGSSGSSSSAGATHK